MEIELKKVKICKFMSEETLCYEAEVWVDGEKAGYAENEGHGGSTNVRLDKKYRHLDTKIFDLPCCTDKKCILCHGTNVWKTGIEDLVDRKMFEEERKKTDKKFENRLKKKGFTFVIHCKESNFGIKASSKAEALTKFRIKYPKDKILRIVDLTK